MERTHRLLWLFAALHLSLQPASAQSATGSETTLVLEILSADGRVSECTSGTVELLPVEGDPADALYLAAETPSRASVHLKPGPWRLSFRGESCWSPETVVTVSSGAEELVARLEVWGAVELTGAFEVDSSDQSGDLILKFAASKEEPSRQPNGKVVCDYPTQRGRFSCLAPKALLDLRLSLKGFAPEYLWQRDLTKDGLAHLGSFSPIAGGSLAGWVATNDGSELPEEFSLFAVPYALAQTEGAVESGQVQLLGRYGTVRENGFFSITSLEGGPYVLTASAPGYADAMAGVLVTEGREVELRDWLVLAEPLTLEVFITPPVTPTGDPWEISVGQLNEYRRFLRPLASGQVELNGYFSWSDIAPGNYLVNVTTDWGEAWASEEVLLDATSPPIQIDIGAVQVAGEVTLGGKPLKADLWFGGKKGSTRVKASSDSEGIYEVVLPRGGDWLVEVDAAAPPVQRKLRALRVSEPNGSRAELNIALPNTRVYGTVRKASGDLATKGIVYLVSTVDQFEGLVWQWFDESGEFDFRGVSKGKVWVYADTGREHSGFISFNTAFESGARDLRLAPKVTVTGTIRDDRNRPIPGAMVQSDLSEAPMPMNVQTVADPDGNFSLQVPRSGGNLLLVAAAPGRTMTAISVPIDSAENISVSLSEARGELTANIPGFDWVSREEFLVAFSDGVPISIEQLQFWSGLHPDLQPDDSDVVVAPRLKAGNYELCRVPAREYRDWVNGKRTFGACDSGSLSAFGTLELTLPD